MTTNRREFIAGTAAVLAFSSKLAAGAKQAAPVDVQALLAGIAEDMLADYPENATSLGIDKDARAGLKARLTDRSAAGQKAIAGRVAQRIERMRAIDVAGLDEATQLDLDVVRTVIETWRQEYNDERPKRSPGGLTPAQYAKQLAAKPITMPENSKSACY